MGPVVRKETEGNVCEITHLDCEALPAFFLLVDQTSLRDIAESVSLSGVYSSRTLDAGGQADLARSFRLSLEDRVASVISSTERRRNMYK